MAQKDCTKCGSDKPTSDPQTTNRELTLSGFPLLLVLGIIFYCIYRLITLLLW